MRRLLRLVLAAFVIGGLSSLPTVDASAATSACPKGMHAVDGGCAAVGASADLREVYSDEALISTVDFLRTPDGTLVLDNKTSDSKHEIYTGNADPKVVDPCTYKAATNVKDGDPRLGGHMADDGYVVIPFCPQALSYQGATYTEMQEEGAVYVPNGESAPPPPPPPNPADLAEEATSLLPIPAPEVHLGPNVEQAVVNMPLWMWVTDPTTGAAPGALTSSVELRGVRVDATATLQETTWDMGEPIDKPTHYQQPNATVTCTGPGAAPPGNATSINRQDRHPDCGYTFQWMSTCERTGGIGTWHVTSNATWQVTWTSNVGIGGTTTLQTTGTTEVEVGEITTVLVNDPNADLPEHQRNC